MSEGSWLGSLCWLAFAALVCVRVRGMACGVASCAGWLRWLAAAALLLLGRSRA